VSRDLDRLQAEALARIATLADAGAAAAGPEAALRPFAEFLAGFLGDRSAADRPGALKPGERQYFVSGAFMVSPDRTENWLIAETGFPPEQHRLRIPIALGHPGWVAKHDQALLLANTDDHAEFKQILKTSRMGSAIFAPMHWGGRLIGQFICAAQARGTMGEPDLAILRAVAPVAAALYVAHGGEAWLRSLAHGG
jgi:hypothetical protein